MKTTRSLIAKTFKAFLFAALVALVTNTVPTASARNFSLGDFDNRSNNWFNNGDDDDFRLDRPGNSRFTLRDNDRDNRNRNYGGRNDWDSDLREFFDLLDRYNNHHGNANDLRRLLQLIAFLLQHGHHGPPPVSP